MSTSPKSQGAEEVGLRLRSRAPHVAAAQRALRAVLPRSCWSEINVEVVPGLVAVPIARASIFSDDGGVVELTFATSELDEVVPWLARVVLEQERFEGELPVFESRGPTTNIENRWTLRARRVARAARGPR